MKKNIIKSVIAAIFVVGAVVSFNVDAKAYSESEIINPGGGVNCTCTSTSGECKANGAGVHQCAPGGTAKCWKYDRNC